MKRTKSFNIGDRVQYARDFLRNTGQMTGEVPFMKGTVAALIPFGADKVLCAINWDNNEALNVLPCNLNKIGTPEIN